MKRLLLALAVLAAAVLAVWWWPQPELGAPGLTPEAATSDGPARPPLPPAGTETASGSVAGDTSGETPAPTGARIIGRVEGVGSNIYVRVMGGGGEVAGQWAARTPIPDGVRYDFAFDDLPVGTPLVLAAWSPMRASAGAIELLRAAGTPAYAERFAAARAAGDHTLALGETVEAVIQVEPIDKPFVRLRLTGLRPDRVPAAGRITIGLHVNESALGVGHGAQERELEAGHPFLAGGPIEFQLQCDCGTEFGYDVRIEGYRWRVHRMPLPPGPGPIEITIALEPRAHDPVARVVDAATGKPLPGALVTPPPPQPPVELDGRIPGLGNDPEFPTPAGWDGWLRAGPPGADGRFRLTERMYQHGVVAVVPGYGCSEWVQPDTAEGAVVLRVVKGNAITGVVTDAAGRPVAGVPVQLVHHGAWPPWYEGDNGGIAWDDDVEPAWPATERGVGPAVTTDGSGRYRFAGVPPGWIVEPRVLASRRALPVLTPPTVPAPAKDPESGEWTAEATATWLEARVAAGELLRFAGTGGAATRALRAAARHGQWVTFRLQFAAGGDAIENVEWRHVHVIDGPVSPGLKSGKSKSEDTGDVTEVVEVDVAAGRITTTRSQSRWFEDDDAPRQVRLYLPAGRNTITFIDTADRRAVVPERIVAGDAPAEIVDVMLRPKR